MRMVQSTCRFESYLSYAQRTPIVTPCHGAAGESGPCVSKAAGGVHQKDTLHILSRSTCSGLPVGEDACVTLLTNNPMRVQLPEMAD